MYLFYFLVNEKCWHNWLEIWALTWNMIPWLRNCEEFVRITWDIVSKTSPSPCCESWIWSNFLIFFSLAQSSLINLSLVVEEATLHNYECYVVIEYFPHKSMGGMGKSTLIDFWGWPINCMGEWGKNVWLCIQEWE